VALSNSVFKGLPSHLCPFGLYFRINFWHPVAAVVVYVTCCSQFDMCLISILSTGSSLNSSKIY